MSLSKQTDTSLWVSNNLPSEPNPAFSGTSANPENFFVSFGKFFRGNSVAHFSRKAFLNVTTHFVAKEVEVEVDGETQTEIVLEEFTAGFTVALWIYVFDYGNTDQKCLLSRYQVRLYHHLAGIWLRIVQLTILYLTKAQLQDI